MPDSLKAAPEARPSSLKLAISGLMGILRVRWKISTTHRALIWTSSFLFPAVFIYIFRDDPQGARENGPIEDFQVTLIGLGALILASSFWRRPVLFRTKFVAGGLALLYMVFFLLEFDTRGFDAPILRRLTNGWVRNAWVTALIAAYAVPMLRRLNQVWSLFVEWIWSLPALYFILAGFFWVFAELVDKLKPVPDPDMDIFVEEIIEVNAAVWMFAAAIATRWMVKKYHAPQAKL